MELATSAAADENEGTKTDSRHDKSEQRCEKDEEIKALIEESRTIGKKTRALEGCQQKDDSVHQGEKRATRWEKTQQILEEFKGIKSISNIKSAREKHSFQKYVGIFRFERKRVFFLTFLCRGNLRAGCSQVDGARCQNRIGLIEF